MEPEEYADLIVDLMPDPGTEEVAITASRGRIAAMDITALAPVPAFATSAMDGFAFDAEGLDRVLSGTDVRVSGDIPAGHDRVDFSPGCAVRVMTGAPVPTGAEVVVPVEYTDASRTGGVPTSIRVSGLPSAPPPRWNIRPIGEDTSAGEVVIRAGQRIGSAGVGLLAMLGITRLSVRKRLHVGLLVTGDELRAGSTDPGDAIVGPLIHNSNLPMLTAAVDAAGATSVGRVCADDPAAFASILEEFAGSVDLVITTGGISAGAYEVVRMALEDTHSSFRRIGMRPGGPQGFGRWLGTPLLHFPGTPTGAFLSFHLFARTLIEGRALRARWRGAVFSGTPMTGHEKGVSMVPGAFNADGEVEAAGRSRLRDFASADVVIRIPRAPSSVNSGDIVEVIAL